MGVQTPDLGRSTLLFWIILPRDTPYLGQIPRKAIGVIKVLDFYSGKLNPGPKGYIYSVPASPAPKIISFKSA
jgi:hypothetical protein